MTAEVEIDSVREALSQPGKLEEFFAGLKSKPHPVLKLPTLEQVVRTLEQVPQGREALTAVLAKRNAKIQAMEDNPLQHGYRPPIWTRAQELLKGRSQLMVLGGIVRRSDRVRGLDCDE